MRIALDVSQIVYRGTGVGRYVYGLTKALLNKYGTLHEFTLYAGVLQRRGEIHKLSQTKPFNSAVWKILPIPPRLTDLVFNQANLPIETLIGKQDIFHSSDWVEPKANLAHITTVHDLAFHYYPETIDPLVLSMQQKRLERIIRFKTHIIADSMNTKNDLMKKYHLKDSSINVVYPGIESDFKPQSDKEIERVKNKYKLPDRFILSVGTQEPRKNLSRLVEAAQKINLPLVLVGRHGWGATTQTLGFVPSQDLPALYGAASLFAYPSLYEGFGFPVLESMAVGTPVVTSNISSLPEIAGEAAILVEPIDVESIAKGLDKALNNKQKLIKAGYMQAAKFTWEKCAASTLEVYEKIYRH